MQRAMRAGARGKGGRAGGKEGKRQLGPRAREAVREAVELGEKDPAGGATRFLELAEIAEKRGMSRVAAFLALRASRLRIQAKDASGALDAGRAAVGFAEGVSDTKRVGRFFARTCKVLKKLDSGAGDELASHARKQLGLKKLPDGERIKPNRSQRRSLAKECNGCGTPIDGASIEFEDDGTVDCPECGADLA